MTSYIALIHKEAASDYGVSFPEFPGCVTAGSDLDEARALAAEALTPHVQGLNEDGDAVPEPRDAYAEAKGYTRSGFLASAARRAVLEDA